METGIRSFTCLRVKEIETSEWEAWLMVQDAMERAF